MVIEKTGNIFDTNCDAIAIPVNLRGVMGAGLAKYFSLRYSHFVPLYRIAIEKGYLRKGVSCLISNKGERFLMFPTKDDYRENSSLEDIQAGLYTLKNSYKKMKIKSIALPALGCGLGHLSFEEVRDAVKYFFDDSELEVELYAPRVIKKHKNEEEA